MRKNSKKTTKSTELYVNMMDPDGILDTKYNLILAKVRANIPIITSEIDDLVRYGAEMVLDLIDDAYDAISANVTFVKDGKLAEKLIKVIKEDLKKETPWYKKVWNWITKPFKKNK